MHTTVSEASMVARALARAAPLAPTAPPGHLHARHAPLAPTALLRHLPVRAAAPRATSRILVIPLAWRATRGATHLRQAPLPAPCVLWGATAQPQPWLHRPYAQRACIP